MDAAIPRAVRGKSLHLAHGKLSEQNETAGTSSLSFNTNKVTGLKLGVRNFPPASDWSD